MKCFKGGFTTAQRSEVASHYLSEASITWKVRSPSFLRRAKASRPPGGASGGAKGIAVGQPKLQGEPSQSHRSAQLVQI